MKLFRGGILFGAILSFCSVAHGQTSFWTGNATGVYENPVNWTNGSPTSLTIGQFITGATFPSETGSTTFTPSGVTTYTITFSTATPMAEALLFRGQQADPTGDAGAGVGTINLNLGTS